MSFGQFLLCKNYLTGFGKYIHFVHYFSKQKSPKAFDNYVLIITYFTKNCKCAELDSNQRCPKAGDLQSPGIAAIRSAQVVCDVQISTYMFRIRRFNFL